MKKRYMQAWKAERMARKHKDTSIPYFDSKKKLWCFGEGEDKAEDIHLERLIQKFAGMDMNFRYRWNGETVTRRTFTEVLEDTLARYETMSTEGFEGDYNTQQRKWMELIRGKLMEVKNSKRGTEL